jgi:hypothetical protein
MADYFGVVEVLTTPDDVRTVWWRMGRNFSPGALAPRFYVDWGRAAGPWTCLNPTAPVVGDCLFVDSARRTFDMQKDLWYRVRAEWGAYRDASLPCQALGTLNAQARLTAKAIVKSLYTGMKKGGIHGFLLRRRDWGPKCSTCADWDTEEPTIGDCPECHGVGVAGGYYPGVDCWVEIVQPRARARSLTEGGLGVADPQTVTGRCVAYPWITAGDLFVPARSNERFIIRKIDHLADMETKPILFLLTMNRLPETSPAMNVPIAGRPEVFTVEAGPCVAVPATPPIPDSEDEQVRSSAASDDAGWRRGLKHEPW